MHARLVLLLVFALVGAPALPPTAGAETPAQARMRAAGARVEAAPGGAQRAAALVDLAAAHTARARETGDPGHYERALEALRRAGALDPDSAALAKIEAWTRLGRHEFAAAETLARTHLKTHPEDPESWALLGDALMEQGRDEEAAQAYQRGMDLRPGPGAYLRAAYVRERAGDLEGARTFLDKALRATPVRESEQHAWTLVRIASLEDRLDRPARAKARLEEALARFPGYHDALAALAEHHLRHGRPEAALGPARRAIEAAPHPERRLVLADALRALGREDEARAAEDAFEREALAHVEQADNENLALVDFYLDRRPDPARALALARREAARRADPATRERLSRARGRVAAEGGELPDRMDEATGHSGSEKLAP